MYVSEHERRRDLDEDRERWRNRDWWREFADVWLIIGRPFSKCVYCGNYKLGYFPGEKFEQKPHCTDERFVFGVVYSFPILRREAPGLTPWDPRKWARWWRDSGAQTSGSYHAVAFCLSLWGGGNLVEWKRRGYSFDVIAAFGVWDDSHRAAFLKWCVNPWRP
jgi:hypothetical protein